MLDYLVLYQSESGNTKKIAASIFSRLPGNSKDLIDIDTDKTIPEANVYFIGFCVHRGSCSMEVSDFLSDLSGKQIALFGTCGMGDSPEYYKDIAGRVSAWIEADNDYLGYFICQGKMPISVREKYLSMKTPENTKMINAMLRNFDMAMLHPDTQDLEGAKAFVQKVFEDIRKEELQYE